MRTKHDRIKSVEEFNAAHPVGRRMIYWKGPRSGFKPSGEAPIARPAEMLGDHTPVVWLEGVSGCIALSHVEPTGEVELSPHGGVLPAGIP